jgi:hypothetical protein
MTFVLNLFTIFPTHKAPAKFGDHSVFHFPTLEIHGTPDAFLLGPQGPDALEDGPPMGERRIRSFQSLVILVDGLKIKRSICKYWSPN